jgi:hypothetical protein
MRTKNANVINPIQPMYNPTQADQERQRSMMMGQQQRKPKKDPKMMGTAPAMGMSKGGKLKDVPADNTGLSKLPAGVRNKMGFKNRGGMINNGKTDYRKSGMFYKGDK